MRFSWFAILALSFSIQARAQQQPAPDTTATAHTESKRLLWIIPNFRTALTPNVYQPITTREKFHIASLDTFDRGTVALALAFGGAGQLSNSSPSFGQGVRGYAHYAATSYADFAVGNYMAEGIFPALLHQDPRYFRRGAGSGWSRLAYSIGQTVRTHNDSGKTQFNYSEIFGNATGVAASMSYYPDNRTAGSAATQLVTQLAVDTASNVLKEFWPDLERKLSRKHKAADKP